MDENQDGITAQILHLRDVEKLSLRQIARQMKIDRKRVGRIIKRALHEETATVVKKNNLDGFMSLISEWYSKHPHLQAQQVYERLKDYGYGGGYTCVKLATLEYRRPPKTAYHPLVFNPGQEAQVDWFIYKHERMGTLTGFLYVLAYSRYAWGIFYPRASFEFFLAGHLECYRHLGGLARGQRYDNLRSVVLSRTPEISYNPNFMDFARFYGFSVYVCNPYSGNEKGRVERKIRDIRASFLETGTFEDLAELNRKFHAWLTERNNVVHRSTGQTPAALLGKERLLRLPINTYPARRMVTARVSKTALVEFETNRYSVPTKYVGKIVTLAVYTGHVEIWVADKEIARHQRCFERIKTIEDPRHTQRLLDHSPKFRRERVRQLLLRADSGFQVFIERQGENKEQEDAAWEIFQLIRLYSRESVLSAIRELNTMNCAKVKALMSRLRMPMVQAPPMVWPKDPRLLELTYEERKLTDYDPHPGDL